MVNQAMDGERLRRIIRETVHETLSGIGFDVSEPVETQADIAYLRRLRRANEKITEKLKGATLTMLLSATLVVLWEAVKRQMKGL